MIKLFEFSQFIDGKNNICSKNFDFNKKYFCVVDCPSKVIIYDVSSMKDIIHISPIYENIEYSPEDIKAGLKSKCFGYAKFISDEEVLIKGEYGDFFIYDISKEACTWEYHSKNDETWGSGLILGENGEILDKAYAYKKRFVFKGMPFFLNYRTGEVNLLEGYKEPEFSSHNGWTVTSGTLVKSSRENHAYLVDKYEIYDIDFVTHSANKLLDIDAIELEDADDAEYCSWEFVKCDSRCQNIILRGFKEHGDSTNERTIILDTETKLQTLIDDSSDQRLKTKVYGYMHKNMIFDDTGRYLAVSISAQDSSYYKDNEFAFGAPFEGYIRIFDTVLRKEIYCNYDTEEEFYWINAMKWSDDELYVIANSGLYSMKMP